MKAILKNIALLAVFAVVFSNLSGCGNSGSADTSSGNAPATNAAADKPGADTGKYPSLVSSIATADIDLIDGTKTKVADRKGNVLLLNLWGVWCAPCRAEMPHLVDMQEKYRDQGFQVLGLNVGDDWGEPEDIGKMQKFAEQLKLNYELARIPEDLTKEFYKLTQFEAIPISLLVDREGRLRGVFLGGSKRVITKMKETVAKVIAGEETGDVAKEGTGSAPDNGDGKKMELKEAETEETGTEKEEADGRN